MTSADQQAFLENLRQALTGDRAQSPLPAGDPVDRLANIYRRQAEVPPRSREESLALLDRVIEAGERINLTVTVHADSRSAARGICRLAAASQPEWGDRKQIAAWNHPLIEDLNLTEALKETGIPVGFPDYTNGEDRDSQRQWIFDAYIGITSADFCLADSATLVLKTRPGQDRSISLVPSIHVAVIRLEQILGSLKELYYILGNDPGHAREGLTPCLTFITGPSKTADIEATMVHGAHGPREVHLLVVTG